MSDNLISNTIEDILENTIDLFAKVIGFDIKRKYRNRKFIMFHKKGIIEVCPILIPTIPLFAFKLLKKRLESRF